MKQYPALLSATLSRLMHRVPAAALAPMRSFWMPAVLQRPDERPLTDRRSASGDELRRRIRNIIAGSGRPGTRLPRRRCPEGAARAVWRQHVAAALTDLRMVVPRGSVYRDAPSELIRSAIAEMARLRIEDACGPILRQVTSIGDAFGGFGRRGDAWVPPVDIPPIPAMSTQELPAFLRTDQQTGKTA